MIHLRVKDTTKLEDEAMYVPVCVCLPAPHICASVRMDDHGNIRPAEDVKETLRS